jgi:hypothetical protein
LPLGALKNACRYACSGLAVMRVEREKDAMA